MHMGPENQLVQSLLQNSLRWYPVYQPDCMLHLQMSEAIPHLHFLGDNARKLLWQPKDVRPVGMHIFHPSSPVTQGIHIQHCLQGQLWTSTQRALHVLLHLRLGSASQQLLLHLAAYAWFFHK